MKQWQAGRTNPSRAIMFAVAGVMVALVLATARPEKPVAGPVANLVRNPGFEDDGKGYALSDLEYGGTTGKSKWSVVDGGHTGRKCLQVIKVEDGGVFGIAPSFSSVGGPQDRVRRFATIWWTKGADNLPAPGFSTVLVNEQWNLNATVVRSARSKPDANGWTRFLCEWEVPPGKTPTYLRLQVHASRGQSILLDDLALYEVSDWKPDEIEKMENSDPTPDAK